MYTIHNGVAWGCRDSSQTNSERDSARLSPFIFFCLTAAGPMETCTRPAALRLQPMEGCEMRSCYWIRAVMLGWLAEATPPLLPAAASAAAKTSTKY